MDVRGDGAVRPICVTRKKNAEEEKQEESVVQKRRRGQGEVRVPGDGGPGDGVAEERGEGAQGLSVATDMGTDEPKTRQGDCARGSEDAMPEDATPGAPLPTPEELTSPEEAALPAHRDLPYMSPSH